MTIGITFILNSIDETNPDEPACPEGRSERVSFPVHLKINIV